jgi:hypothetical protein
MLFPCSKVFVRSVRGRKTRLFKKMDTFKNFNNKFVSEMDCINILSSISNLKCEISKLKRQQVYEEDLELERFSHSNSSAHNRNLPASQNIDEEEKEMVRKNQITQFKFADFKFLKDVRLLILIAYSGFTQNWLKKLKGSILNSIQCDSIIDPLKHPTQASTNKHLLYSSAK